MIDLSGFRITINHGSEQRYPFLKATLHNLLSCVTGATIDILFNFPMPDHYPDYLKKILGPVAKHYDNIINLHQYPSDKGIGAVKSLLISRIIDENWHHWMTCDDDFLIPYDTLGLIRYAAQIFPESILCYGNWDVYNGRGYRDWDDKVWASYSEFIEQHGVRTIAHHLWMKPCDLTLLFLEHLTPSYIIPKKCVKDIPIDLLQNVPKGQRGYGITMGKMLKDAGYSINYIVGANAFHLGVETALLNETWQSKLPIVEQTDGQP